MDDDPTVPVESLDAVIVAKSARGMPTPQPQWRPATAPRADARGDGGGLPRSISPAEMSEAAALKGADNSSNAHAGASSPKEMIEVDITRSRRFTAAAQPKYHFTNFPKLRSPQDFARGLMFGREIAKTGRLQWQPSIVPTSLIDFPSKELAKTATRIHRNILGYTGDKAVSYPATLARDILAKGLELPDLVDEIFVQLCKHLTNNPRNESVIRSWQIMCMCVGTFSPSRDYEMYLLNFILDHKDDTGAVGNYVRYLLARLEDTIDAGSSGSLPSLQAIEAYMEHNGTLPLPSI